MADPNRTDGGRLSGPASASASASAPPRSAPQRPGPETGPQAWPAPGPSPDLAAWAAEAGPRTELFQLIRLLEAARPAAARVGTAVRPAQEGVRLRAWDSLAFAPRDVMSVTPTGDGGDRLAVAVSALGLFGPTSPLPAHVTERVIQGEEGADNLRDFLNLFNHRLLTLLVRIWRTPRYFLGFEPQADDATSRWLFAAMGLDRTAPGLFRDLDPPRLLAYAGILALPTAPASAVEAVVADYLGGAPVRVEPLVLRQVTIADDQRTRLGRHAHRLGDSLLIGERVPDVAGKFRLHIGPIPWRRFVTLLPDRAAFAALCRLVGLILRDRLAYDVVLSPERAEVPAWTLGAAAAETRAGRLGHTTWLGSPGPDDAAIPFPAPLDTATAADREALA